MKDKKSIIALGPGAPSLILIFVVLALSMLSMLALMNGRNDAKLSERSVQVIEDVYALNVQAEERLAQLDAVLADCLAQAADEEEYRSLALHALPDEMELEEDVIRWTESDGMRNLHCEIRLMPYGASKRTAWIRHTLISAAVEAAEEAEEEMFDW